MISAKPNHKLPSKTGAFAFGIHIFLSSGRHKRRVDEAVPLPDQVDLEHPCEANTQGDRAGQTCRHWDSIRWLLEKGRDVASIGHAVGPRNAHVQPRLREHKGGNRDEPQSEMSLALATADRPQPGVLLRCEC